MTGPREGAQAEPEPVVVRCWHTEPGTPCDWWICRQPQRLAAGDTGRDPARGTS